MRKTSAPADAQGATNTFVPPADASERIQPREPHAERERHAAPAAAPVRAPVGAIGWGTFP